MVTKKKRKGFSLILLTAAWEVLQALACCYRPSRPVIKEDDARFSSSRCTDEAGHNALQKKKTLIKEKKNTERKERRIRSREGSYTKKKKKERWTQCSGSQWSNQRRSWWKKTETTVFFSLFSSMQSKKKNNNNNKRLIEFHRSRNRMRRGAIGTWAWKGEKKKVKRMLFSFVVAVVVSQCSNDTNSLFVFAFPPCFFFFFKQQEKVS